MSAFLDWDPQFPLGVLARAEPWGRALQPCCQPAPHCSELPPVHSIAPVHGAL